MEDVFAGLVEEWGLVFVFGELLFRSILGGHMGVRLMLGFSRSLVLETDEGLFHIFRHGDVDFAFVIVPINHEPEVPCAFPFV